MAVEKKWLVEIRIKDWIPTPSSGNRTLHYEEVFSTDEYSARHLGFDTFSDRVKYEPRFKKMLTTLGITIKDTCAPDAVALD